MECISGLSVTFRIAEVSQSISGPNAENFTPHPPSFEADFSLASISSKLQCKQRRVLAPEIMTCAKANLRT